MASILFVTLAAPFEAIAEQPTPGLSLRGASTQYCAAFQRGLVRVDVLGGQLSAVREILRRYGLTGQIIVAPRPNIGVNDLAILRVQPGHELFWSEIFRDSQGVALAQPECAFAGSSFNGIAALPAQSGTYSRVWLSDRAGGGQSTFNQIQRSIELTIKLLRLELPTSASVNIERFENVLVASTGGYRGHVIKHRNYWERLRFLIAYPIGKGGPQILYLHVEGSFAPGIGKAAPPLSTFRSMTPEFQLELTEYVDQLKSKLVSALVR